MSDWDFLWELKGQEYYDALYSGGTYADWAFIEKQEREKRRGVYHKKQNTIVFIDAEGVSHFSAEEIEEHIKDIGQVAEVRYYAMQKDPATKGWKDTEKKYGYKAILLSGERTRNKIDDKLIKDAKNILVKNKSIDIFVLVTKDGDFTELATYLRQNGKRVVLLAPLQTSKELKSVCSQCIDIQ